MPGLFRVPTEFEERSRSSKNPLETSHISSVALNVLRNLVVLLHIKPAFLVALVLHIETEPLENCES